MICVRKSSSCMGADLDGLDLSQPLSDATFNEVRDALHRYHVLAIRGQKLQPASLIEFSKRFGPPEPHVLDQFHHPQYSDILMLSNVVRDGKPVGLADVALIGTAITPIWMYRRGPRCCIRLKSRRSGVTRCLPIRNRLTRICLKR